MRKIDEEKQSVKAVHRKLQKAAIRLAKKNKKMMSLNAVKNDKDSEIDELRSKVKDLEYIVEQKDVDLRELSMDKSALNRMDALEDENSKLLDEITNLNKDSSKKGAVIELLQKSDCDYKGLISLKIEAVKARWIGWGEGAKLEEVDFSVINNHSEPLTDVVLDMHVEDCDGNSFKHDMFRVAKQLNPKTRLARKIHLFKKLAKKGKYNIILKVFIDNGQKEITSECKTITI